MTAEVLHFSEFLAVTVADVDASPAADAASVPDAPGVTTPDAAAAGADAGQTPPRLPPSFPDGGTGVPACIFGRQSPTRLPPELLLVLDRSGSMRTEVPGSGGNSRWVEVTAALDDAIKQTEASVMWGLRLFPNNEVCGVTGPVEVPVSANNYASTGGIIKASQPQGQETPTGAAVRSATKHLQSRTDSRSPKYILLVTDGEPNCFDGNPSSTMNAAKDTMAAIASAFADGYHTFVVGIAIDNSSSHALMNSLANAGGDAKYYAVANKADLVTALSQIVVRASTCTFPLDVPPPSPNDVGVYLGGKRVPRDKLEGWNYGANMKSIQLYGSWCDGLKSGAGTDLTIVFGCPGVITP